MLALASFGPASLGVVGLGVGAAAAGVVMAFVGGMVSAKAPSLGLTGKAEDVQTDSEIPYILLFPAPCIDYAKKEMFSSQDEK